MKVILLGELRGKGGEGDVVDVAQGFAEKSGAPFLSSQLLPQLPQS